MKMILDESGGMELQHAGGVAHKLISEALQRWKGICLGS